MHQNSSEIIIMATKKQADKKAAAQRLTRELYDYVWSKQTLVFERSKQLLADRLRKKLENFSVKETSHYTNNIGNAVVSTMFLLRDYLSHIYLFTFPNTFKDDIKLMWSHWIETRDNIFVKVIDTFAIVAEAFMHCDMVKSFRLELDEIDKLFLELFDEHLADEFFRKGGWKQLDKVCAEWYQELYRNLVDVSMLAGTLTAWKPLFGCCHLVDIVRQSVVPFPVADSLFCDNCRHPCDAAHNQKVVYVRTKKEILQAYKKYPNSDDGILNKSVICSIFGPDVLREFESKSKKLIKKTNETNFEYTVENAFSLDLKIFYDQNPYTNEETFSEVPTIENAVENFLSSVVTGTVENSVESEKVESIATMQKENHFSSTENIETSFKAENEESFVASKKLLNSFVAKNVDNAFVTGKIESCFTKENFGRSFSNENLDRSFAIEKINSLSDISLLEISSASEKIESTFEDQNVESSFADEKVKNSSADDKIESFFADKNAQITFEDENVQSFLEDGKVESSFAAENVKNCLVSETVEISLVAENVENSLVSENVENSLESETVESCVVSETVESRLVSETIQICFASETVESCIVSETVESSIASETVESCFATVNVENSLTDKISSESECVQNLSATDIMQLCDSSGKNENNSLEIEIPTEEFNQKNAMPLENKCNFLKDESTEKLTITDNFSDKIRIRSSSNIFITNIIDTSKKDVFSETRKLLINKLQEYENDQHSAEVETQKTIFRLISEQYYNDLKQMSKELHEYASESRLEEDSAQSMSDTYCINSKSGESKSVEEPEIPDENTSFNESIGSTMKYKLLSLACWQTSYVSVCKDYACQENIISKESDKSTVLKKSKKKIRK